MAVLALVLTGCGASAAPDRPLPSMVRSVDGSTPKNVAPSTAVPVPDTSWDRLSAAGEAHDKLGAGDAGLPAAYIPDRGEDAYDRPRARWVRRDMAAYLLRVRTEDPQLADRLGWQLQAVPPAWCSIVLPTRTPEELTDQVAAANTRGKALARALGVRWEPPADDRRRRLLTFAREEAARRFCPEQAASPGRAVPKNVTTAGRMPGNDAGADVLDSALPVVFSPAWSPLGGGTRIGGDELRIAYVGILVGSAQVDSVRTWPVALDCSLIEDHGLLQPDTIDETADNIRELMRMGAKTKQEAARNATDFAARSFDLLERRRQCRE